MLKSALTGLFASNIWMYKGISGITPDAKTGCHNTNVETLQNWPTTKLSIDQKQTKSDWHTRHTAHSDHKQITCYLDVD